MSSVYSWKKLTCWSAYFAFVVLLFNDGLALAAQADTTLAKEIRIQLQTNKNLPLYFPRSVKRFYAGRGFKPAWLIKEKGETGHAWQAMLLLDCVRQYGLSYTDYHPGELSYGVLHDIAEPTGKVGTDQQARFEIMLTDAILTFMVHLHYGKLNPELPAAKIDSGQGNLRVEAILAQAMLHSEIAEVLLNVQPKGQAYQEMQHWMHKWEGQYLGDCYEIPEADVRKVAINMERLRWAAIGNGPYLQVDIPSFTLSLFLADSTYRFKIVAGSRATPTPLLHSKITAIALIADTTWLDREKSVVVIPQDKTRSLITFIFSGSYSLSLGEIRETKLLGRKVRALSLGSIGVEKADRLATLLLQADRQQDRLKSFRRNRKAGKAMVLKLHSPLPLKITYITCGFQDAQMITYPDIYQLDRKLEQAIYHELPKKLAKR